ncbi:hypothetical protein EGK_02879, partial [Macaca mulatta]
GDSKKPSKKHVKREPCSTSTLQVTSSSTTIEILRRYSLYTTQRWRHHGFWGRKKVHPQEASEESPALKDRGDGERPVNARVVQVVPLRCDSSKYSGRLVQCMATSPTETTRGFKTSVNLIQQANAEAACLASCKEDSRNVAGLQPPYGDPVQDTANKDTVRDIADTVRNICNEDALYEITNEAAVHDTNQHAVQDICKKDAAKEPFILENDLIVESISDDEDFAG